MLHPAIAKRRTFFEAAAAVLAMGSAATGPAAGFREGTGPAKRLDLLILGGTGFTGPHQVRYALDRGHKVTLLNRNNRPGMFEGEVERLTGDLNGDLGALAGRKFDVVIDNPTTFPAWVRNAARYLTGNVRHYIFISTISVYADNRTPGQDESARTLRLPAGLDPYTQVPDDAGGHYGALKAFAEREVERHYSGLATIIRPGLIVGPRDPSDRFTYWPVRIAKGGRVLAPGTPMDRTQIIDARDLAEWTVRVAEQRVFGTYNALGPAQPLTMGTMLGGVRDGVGGEAEFAWVPAGFLREHGVNGWSQMPAWVPPDGDTGGLLTRSNARAVGQGLSFRPLAVTARDTLHWHSTRTPQERQRVENAVRAGITIAKEADVLAAWARETTRKG